VDYTRLGRTGLKVSRLCLGTMTFGVRASEAESRAIMDHAADGGVSFFDCADVYPLGGDPRPWGLSEEIVGDWLHGKRQHFVLATKCGEPVGPNAWDRGTSRRHILESVDNSLRRLKTDWIDLYQLHIDDPETPIDEMMDALDAVVRSGKVRYIGCSKWAAYRLALALGISDKRGLARFDCVQPRYSIIFRQWERDLFRLCTETGVGVIVFSPLAGGMLSGKYLSTEAPAEGTRFATHQLSNVMYWHAEIFDAVEQLKAVATEIGLSLPSLAIAWTLSQPVITAPIIGASKVEHLEPSLIAAQTRLAPDVLARLDDITRRFRQGDAEF
jgi:aryl-alcohol dehydrogenase-like predicted oxidoreductase